MEKDNVIKTLLNDFEQNNSLISSFHLQFGAVQGYEDFQELLDKCIDFFDNNLLYAMDDGVFPISTSLIHGLIHATIGIRDIDKEIPFSLDIARDAVVNMLFTLRQAHQRELEEFRKRDQFYNEYRENTKI